MRKITLFWLWLACMICTAKPITLEEAKAISARFMAQHSTATRTPGTNQLELKHVFRSKTTNNALCYVFSRKDHTGFIIASGDDSSEAILGYSDTETFDFINMAPATRWWLENYQKQIEYSSKNGLSQRTRGADERHNIAPLIQTQWNQEAPYNSLCPFDNKTQRRCLTGCVATATAQLMYYHKWPKKGTGGHSYDWNGKRLSADFGSAYFQWDKMKTTYKDNEDTDNAIATLMYNCGVALEMNYGGWVSWAYFRNGEILSKHFGYSPDYKRIVRNDVGNNAFENALYNDLANGLPVLFGGQDKNKNEGHQFICDGYKKGGYYHMNWGWGGWNDGYFVLSALNVSDGRQWNWEQEIFCGIKKYEKETTVNRLIFEDNGNKTATLKGGQPNSNLVIPTNVQINGQLCKVTIIGKEAFMSNTEITSVTIPASITNIGDRAFNGCANLREISLQDNNRDVLHFGNGVFENCKTGKVFIGRNVTNTPLRGMKSLKTIELGSGITKLNDFELFDTGIETISIPSQVVIIGKGALGNCWSLQSLKANKANSKYESDAGILYNKGKTEIVCYPSKKADTKFICPASIVTVLPYAFCESKNLTEIIFQTKLNNICENAFLTKDIKSITIVNGKIPSCETISFSSDMQSKSIIYVPKGLISKYKTSKGWNGFNKFMEIPDNAGSYTYTINGMQATITGGNVSGNITIPSTITLGGVTLGVTAIANGSFKNNAKITDITIPSSIKSIGTEAFLDCKNLVNLTIKDSKSEVTCGKDLFKNAGLKNTYFGRTLTGNSIFGGLSSLSYVTLSNNVKTLPPLMFYMTGLRTIDIPSSVVNIDSETFYKTKNLERINVQPSNTSYSSEGGVLYNKDKTTLILLPLNSKINDFKIPETVVNIKRHSIINGNIKSIVIPSCIQTIETDAILCPRLESVYINSSVPPIVNEYGFSATQFLITNTTLCVPVGSINLYKKAKCWSRFQRIIENKPTDIESILLDNTKPNKIYSIDGKSVPIKVNSLKDLFPGIYIIDGHKVIIQ